MSTDDRRPADDDLDATERALAARLTSALLGQASTVVLADEAFDPTRPTALDLAHAPESQPQAAAPGTARTDLAAGIDTPSEHDGLPPLPVTPIGPRRRPPVAMWLAGAAAAVILVAALVLINGARESGLATDGESRLLVDPDVVWVPGWLPDGLQLWGVGVGDAVQYTEPTTGERPQLRMFEAADGSGAAIIAVTARDDGRPKEGRELTGRGTTIWSAPSESWGTASLTALSWTEGTVAVGALTRDLSDEETLALLDSLVVADPADPMAGFALPPDSPWTVREEPAVPTGTGRSASYVYDRAVPTGEAEAPLQVTTYSVADGYPGYLMTSIAGRVDDDGVAIAHIPPGSGNSGPPTTVVAFPDGHSAMVYGAGVDDATAERVGRDVRSATIDDVRAIETEMSDRLAASGSVLASADLPDGRVEVIGAAEPTAICVTVSGARSCRSRDHSSGSESQSQPLFGTAMIGSTWYVFAADPGGVRLTPGSSGSFSGVATAVPSGDGSVEVDVAAGTVPTTVVPSTIDPATDPSSYPGTGSDAGGPIPGTIPNASVGPAAPTAIDAGWTLSVLRVPDGVDQATANFDGYSTTMSRSLL